MFVTFERLGVSPTPRYSRQQPPKYSYFGTLNIAKRFLPILMVSRRVPGNTRLRPRSIASFHPFPFVIFSPRLALRPNTFVFFATGFAPVEVDFRELYKSYSDVRR